MAVVSMAQGKAVVVEVKTQEGRKGGRKMINQKQKRSLSTCVRSKNSIPFSAVFTYATDRSSRLQTTLT